MTTINKMLISFTAGAILGILYAPAKGAKTRKKIANIGSDMKDRWNNITDNTIDRMERVRDGIDNIVDKAIEKVEISQFDINDKAGYL